MAQPGAILFDTYGTLFNVDGWDALGATWYGFRTRWVTPIRCPLKNPAAQPERIGSSLRDVLEFF